MIHVLQPEKHHHIITLLTTLHVEGNFIHNHDKPIHVLVQLNGYNFIATLE